MGDGLGLVFLLSPASDQAPRWERAYDIGLGLSALSWAGLGFVRAEGRPLAVRIALAGLNLLVGLLFLRRSASVASGGVRAIAASLPSMVLGALAVRFAQTPPAFVAASSGAPAHWPAPGQVLFVLGAALTCASLATLGRSFAFLPSRRELVVRGPYRVVRHPAYLGELIMLLGCAFTTPWLGVPLAVLVALTLGLRIRAEERLLSADPGWQQFAERVRWRLLPGVY